MLLLLVGCSGQPQIPPQSEFGPARLAKVDRGYELVNRKLRLVIDEKTGDVVYLGKLDGRSNLLTELGIGGVVVGVPHATPSGYVEKRDDQTWQYLGDSPGIGWRKIYCLERDSLFVTYLIENKADKEVSASIAVRAHFQGASKIVAQPDLFVADVSGVTVRLQAFNEGQYQMPHAADTLIGDTKNLKPGERISLTMEWTIAQ